MVPSSNSPGLVNPSRSLSNSASPASKGHKIPGRTRAKLQDAHIHTVEQAAERLDISRCTLVHWIELGLLKATQITPGAPWRVELTDDDYRRLTAGDAPAG